MAAVERRLTCEGMLTPKSKHTTGIYDEPMRLAVRSFQQKHMIYESNYLRKKTVEALAKPLLDNDYEGLVRALRERVVSAAAIVEDGTAGTPKHPSRDLADEYTKATLEQLGLGNADTALEFFKRHGAEQFKSFRVAIKLPPRPEYYSDAMDLSIVVDRGDVWYDFPVEPDGHWQQQPRKHYPHLTLFVKWKGQQIPLARWRTTIGGWRAEQASDGYEYYRYKMSDVGPRVIRQVVSGPVWIAPPSTPIRTLVKGKLINSSWMKVVNYDELGPGYLSAYGIIAGYFVIPGLNGKPDFDNGVRAHGSSDYLSIYSSNGFSHGCHRLPNHLAIRMYSFILRHRKMHVAGDQPMDFTRQFLFGENGVRDAHPLARLRVLPGSAAAGEGARRQHHGHAEEADHRLRPQARREVSRPAASRARQPRSQGRRRWRRRGIAMTKSTAQSVTMKAKTKQWFAIAARIAGAGRFPVQLGFHSGSRAAAGAGRAGSGRDRAAGAAVGQGAHHVHGVAALVEGDGLLGPAAPGDDRAAPAADRRAPARQRAAGRGREGAGLFAGANARVHVRDSKVSVKMTPPDQKKTLLGYREAVPDGGAPSD